MSVQVKSTRSCRTVSGQGCTDLKASASTPLPTQLADVGLVIGGQPVRLVYVSPSQINALVPNSLGPGLYRSEGVGIDPLTDAIGGCRVGYRRPTCQARVCQSKSNQRARAEQSRARAVPI